MSRPLLSILVPTTAEREAFWPWLSWNIRKQRGLDWRRVEVLVASPDGVHVELDVPCEVRRTHYRGAPPVGLIRNQLMGGARGSYIAWFDDDDWHHPERLAFALRHLERSGPPEGECLWVGFEGLRYLDLETERTAHIYNYRQRVVPVTVVGERHTLSDIGFSTRAHGSDTKWLEELRESYAPRVGLTLPEPRRTPFFLALSHGRNMSPHIAHFRYTTPLATWAGDWALADTGQELAYLRARLQGTPTAT